MSLLAQALGQGEARLLTGADIDAAALAAEVRGASVVHLATHAFTLPVVSAGDPDSRWNQRVAGLSPLLLTGLALSQANAGGDGLLNGETLATFDLSRCKLAVLSGCATSLGEAQTWQGFASLGKAACMAGAESVVTSLWPVDDRWTEVLMEAFHRARWEQQLPDEQALWQAQMTVRRQNRLPRHWAGWVLTSATSRRSGTLDPTRTGADLR